MPLTTPPAPRFHGRRAGRRLSPALLTALEAVGDRYALTLSPEASHAPLDPATLFSPACTRYALEIGFGMGEHLLTRAVAEPETGFLGIEPFRNGVARLTAGLQDANADNVRIWNDDVHLLLPLLQRRLLLRLLQPRLLLRLLRLRLLYLNLRLRLLALNLRLRLLYLRLLYLRLLLVGRRL